MTPLTVGHDDARDALIEAADTFVTAAVARSDHDLLGPSRCWGWAGLDVVVHVRGGLDEMLRGFTAPTSDPATADAASYWAGEAPVGTGGTADDVAGILWLRRTASAYRTPSSALGHLRDAVAAMTVAARAAEPGRVRFQRQVLTTADFMATWAVELAIHHLDLDLPSRTTGPPASALRLARRTLEALLDAHLDPRLDDTACVLLAAGRTRPDDAQRRMLGDVAGRLPALH